MGTAWVQNGTPLRLVKHRNRWTNLRFFPAAA
jgi:hypothetical protein